MSMPDTQEVAEAIVAALGDELSSLVSVYLFGSLAEDRGHRDSDADVAVLLSRERVPTAAERFEARLRISSRLSGRLRRTVDLVVLNDVPPGLGRHVVTRGVRVLVRDPAADHAFVRDVQLRAADLEPFLRRLRRVKLEALARR